MGKQASRATKITNSNTNSNLPIQKIDALKTLKNAIKNNLARKPSKSAPTCNNGYKNQ
ncbi:hypothetical protein UFOVP606_32 [uncultured Caudovirales phage]|uniref:Uncharacterized protein n=1 Tax=uncultured Caudovirales phage TaxID=2100421 RepID=A0A6J5N6W5_9CAUD|nr:hypothetical protein UFOVP606_32 [uncultured Caudovirales phage]